MSYLCAYFGYADECSECGGFNETGTKFCSHDCAAHRADRVAEMDARIQERRDRENAFAREVERLRVLGHNDQEIDHLLAGMPT